ncbi:uncharacterized protein A4U43_C07F32960 [Asparagus officinalis]|uniref:Uncharacterized protein n=1 Tax=Asparagus officinalis TaxID=4686 RepID=A0A5P1EIL8_ASPOF|nr:uncharacterized protein A4U43_C07F32960 [Asparagus officinalis]
MVRGEDWRFVVDFILDCGTLRKVAAPRMEANSNLECSDELRSLPSDNVEENTNKIKWSQFSSEKDLIATKFVKGMEFANPNETCPWRCYRA